MLNASMFLRILLLGLLGSGYVGTPVNAFVENRAGAIVKTRVNPKTPRFPLEKGGAGLQVLLFKGDLGGSSSGNPTNQETSQANPTPAETLDLDPEVLEESPLWRDWVEEVPNVLSEIRTDPSFRTRLRLGYSHFADAEEEAGFHVGVEDVFLGRSHFTVSGDYQANFEGDRELYGANLRYYVFPLGSYVNVAPVVGYRSVEINEFNTDGLDLGLRLLLSLSRTGAADLALTHTWVSPNESDEVGMTTLAVGYALTRQLRLSTELQRQGSPEGEEARLGVGLEWLFR